jgi:pimeloyl-ACP methyl ester carboxylesterase
MGSPHTLGDKPDVQEIWDSTLSRLTDPVDPGFVREFQQSAVAQPVPQAFFRMVVRESLKAPARVWRATFQGLLEDDSAKALGQIRAPTLVMWGDQDTVLSRDDQETLVAAIPGARLVVYSGAGHALYWEEPDRIASDLVAFVEDLVS